MLSYFESWNISTKKFKPSFDSLFQIVSLRCFFEKVNFYL